MMTHIFSQPNFSRSRIQCPWCRHGRLRSPLLSASMLLGVSVPAGAVSRSRPLVETSRLTSSVAPSVSTDISIPRHPSDTADRLRTFRCPHHQTDTASSPPRSHRRIAHDTPCPTRDPPSLPTPIHVAATPATMPRHPSVTAPSTPLPTHATSRPPIHSTLPTLQPRNRQILRVHDHIRQTIPT